MVALFAAALVAIVSQGATLAQAAPIPLSQQPGFQRASVHVGGKGPGHLARKQGAGGGVAPTSCDGSLDLSTGCSSAVVVIF